MTQRWKTKAAASVASKTPEGYGIILLTFTESESSPKCLRKPWQNVATLMLTATRYEMVLDLVESWHEN
jgi:hypothetical protein